jgi:hypothetical protein
MMKKVKMVFAKEIRDVLAVALEQYPPPAAASAAMSPAPPKTKPRSTAVASRKGLVGKA